MPATSPLPADAAASYRWEPRPASDNRLAFDVAASPAHLYHILTATEGPSAFWTRDCDVRPGHARFAFPGEATVEAAITTQPERLVRMHSTSMSTAPGR